MKPWTMWLARLGIAGACVMATGCGNGGVPDPSSDEQAASDPAPPPDAGGGAPPPARERPTAVASAPTEPKADEAPAEEPAEAPAEAEKPAAKADAGSATAEMLAMATNPGGSAQPSTGTTPAAPQGMQPPTMQGQGGMPPKGPGMPGPGGAGGMMGAQMRPGGPMGGAGGGPNPSDMASQMQMQQKMQMQRGQGGQGNSPGAMAQLGGPGMPGRPGGPGGSAANDKPADFRTPEGAVEAFLAALEAKDADRLSEASALRASVEPPEKNKTLFKKIFELSLSDTELDELSKNFEGYKIAGENPVKSTGRVEVVLQKSGDDGSRYTRVVTVRREKKGWGVLLLKSATEFKPLGQTPRRRTGTGGGR